MVEIVDDTKIGKEIKERWYNHYTFPLIPRIQIKRKNDFNKNQFNIKWLFFNIWSLDHLEFEAAFVIDPAHWGIGFTFILFYLRIIICIPTIAKISTWWTRKTTRNILIKNNYGS